MNDFAWIAPLKEAVLLLFFLLFSAILVWTARLSSIEDLSNIPLRDEETPA
jgi:hypothetical protein